MMSKPQDERSALPADAQIFPMGGRSVLKITFVIDSLRQEGAAKQLSLLARNLPRDQFATSVVVLDRGGILADTLRETGVDVEIIGRRLSWDPQTLWRLKKLLQQQRPDVVHTWTEAGNYYGRLAALWARVPHLVASERSLGSWKQQYQRLFERELGRWTDAVVANSAPVAQLCCKTGIAQEKVRTIANAIDNDSPSEAPAQSLRAELGIAANYPVVGYLGRLVPNKRVQDLIWATDVLRMHGWNMTLLIMGEGTRRPALQRFTRSLELDNMVRFLGHRDDPQRFLEAIDVLALPSRGEGFSNAVLEAMHAQKPVVAVRGAGIEDLILDEENGLLVPAKQPFKLAEAISSLLQDPERRRQMGENGHQRVQQNYPLAQMVASYGSLYREILGHS